jgi:hypothetical protein
MKADLLTFQVAAGLNTGAVRQPSRNSAGREEVGPFPLARPGNAPKRAAGSLEFGTWIFGCLIAVLGVLKAAYGPQHLFWLMVWPVPVAMAYTIFFFVRQGFHFENGVLVLGRRRDGR